MDDNDCRVYWGRRGCGLRRGHDGPHRQLEPVPDTITPADAYLFGEDLTDEERRQIAELWD